MKKFFAKVFTVRSLTVVLLALEILLFVFGIYFISTRSETYIGEYMVVVRMVIGFLAAIAAILTFSSKTPTSYKITWLLFIAMVPALGSFFYILFAKKRFRKGDAKNIRDVPAMMKRSLEDNIENNQTPYIDPLVDANARTLGEYLNRYAGNGIYDGTEAVYYPWGELALPAMLEELSKAKHYIFMEYFIIQPGKMWDSLLAVLKQKAAEGLDVRLLYDDFGCLKTLPSRYYLQMREAGIKCYAVNPLRPLFNIRLNNRDHRKICVIDGHTGFTGGINLADEYINEEIRFGKWKDNAILLRGEAVYGLTSLFLATWGHVSHEPITDFKPYLPSVYASEMEASPKGEGYIAPYGYHPLTSEPACHEVYVSLIAKATRSIDIMTPYFIPDEELEQALIRAAKSGVRVRLITPHIPDKPTIFDVTRSFYQNLVEAGAEVYEYTPGFVHAKVMVIDDDMATVGTVNFDFRSLYLHMENGCFLYHNPVVSDVKRDVEETLKECKQITLEMVESTPVSKRLYRAILRLISTAL